MRNIITGGQYMFGALIVGTLWSLAAYGIIEASVERVVEGMAVEHAEAGAIDMPIGPNGI